jgi:hypothetical protein
VAVANKRLQVALKRNEINLQSSQQCFIDFGLCQRKQQVEERDVAKALTLSCLLHYAASGRVPCSCSSNLCAPLSHFGYESLGDDQGGTVQRFSLSKIWCLQNSR